MGISIWGILKSAIGKDLTKLTLPATVNEPLSALQRLAEDMEQVDFLDKAQKAQSAASRMLWVALYAATPVNSAILRYRKPFNPLLGETFEWLSRDSRHRFLAEQVSHHPPVACVNAQGPGYSVLGEMQLVSSFWGKAITMKNEGGITAELTGTKEKYSWKKPTFTINSIILGNPWIEAIGTTSISCSNGASCTRLTFVARIACFRIANFSHDHRIRKHGIVIQCEWLRTCGANDGVYRVQVWDTSLQVQVTQQRSLSRSAKGSSRLVARLMEACLAVMASFSSAYLVVCCLPYKQLLNLLQQLLL
jgi:hypothetical protein